MSAALPDHEHKTHGLSKQFEDPPRKNVIKHNRDGCCHNHREDIVSIQVDTEQDHNTGRRQHRQCAWTGVLRGSHIQHERSNDSDRQTAESAVEMKDDRHHQAEDQIRKISMDSKKRCHGQLQEIRCSEKEYDTPQTHRNTATFCSPSNSAVGVTLMTFICLSSSYSTVSTVPI